ncbi:MAG: hypothetical protein WAO52_18930 [Prolixibacteraceae bacterium]
MDTKTPIQAEIKDGKLIIDGEELNLEGLKALSEDEHPSSLSNELQRLFTSISMIGALIAGAGPSGKVDGESLSLNFPDFSSLYALKTVVDSFKIM